MCLMQILALSVISVTSCVTRQSLIHSYNVNEALLWICFLLKWTNTCRQTDMLVSHRGNMYLAVWLFSCQKHLAEWRYNSWWQWKKTMEKVEGVEENLTGSVQAITLQSIISLCGYGYGEWHILVFQYSCLGTQLNSTRLTLHRHLHWLRYLPCFAWAACLTV